MLWWIVVAAVLVAALGASLYAVRPLLADRKRALSSTQSALALPLAIIERACTDAVTELCKAAQDERPLFVSPFDPTTYPIAAVSSTAIEALGEDAPEEHRQLVAAMQRWNAAAFSESRVERLLPTILVAHEAAQRLARRLEGTALDVARRVVATRVLLSLVAEPPSQNAVVH